MDNSLSRVSTLPEPVAWDSRPSAAAFTTALALKRLAWWGRGFKAIVWNFFCFFVASATIILGWPLCWSAVFFPFKDQQICSAIPSFYPFNCLIKSSYSRQYPKISFFCILSLTFTTPSTQITNAEPNTIAIPTRLIIPRIDLDRPVVPVGLKKIEVANQIYQQWAVDDDSVGWHNLSAPLGEGSNSVLNGHSNVYAQVFRDLDKVQIGDTIIAFAGSQAYYYVIAEKFLVQEKGTTIEKRLENAKLILPTSDERLTLITCAHSGATHRLIIIAHPMKHDE